MVVVVVVVVVVAGVVVVSGTRNTLLSFQIVAIQR